MKEKLSSLKKRFLDGWSAIPKNARIISLVLLVGVAGWISLAFANEGHEEVPLTQSTQSEKVLIRTVGDVDPDGISQEGLNSFYGQIVSKDVGAIYGPREGVISSWNVSIGDKVNVGSILGYITVTSLSAEQQQNLAMQQAAAFKADLDLQTAKQITAKTQGTFAEISKRTQELADKQRSLLSGSNNIGTAGFVTELSVLESNRMLLETKVQDFARTSLVEIIQLIGQDSSSIFSDTYPQAQVQLKSIIGQRNITLRTEYTNTILPTYVKKVRERKVTVAETQHFIDSTVALLSASVGSNGSQEYLDPQLKADITRLSEIQDSLRDLSNELAQATVERSAKERERLQVDVDVSKQIVELDNNFSLQLLEQEKTNQIAQNEARAAQLLAQKLAGVSSGVVPILASRSGIIATVDKNVGSYVTNSDRIGLISNENPSKMVRFTIPAAWKDIKKGDSLSVLWRAEFGEAEGTLTGISPIIDEKGGYQAEMVLPKNTVYPIGAAVRIIPNSSKKGVFVTRKSIVFDGTEPSIWIVTEENIIRKQLVKPGRQLGEYVEILSGVEKGFRYLVILDPTISMETGMNIDALMKSNTKVETTNPANAIQDESQPHSHDE